MNQLDLFLGFVVLFFALGGLFGGAVRRVIQIAALIIAFREAWRLAPWVESVLGGGDGQSISGWGFIFALVYIGIRLMGNWFSSLTKGTFLSVIDRIKWGGQLIATEARTPSLKRQPKNTASHRGATTYYTAR